MVKLDQKTVEDEIIKVVEDLNVNLKIQAEISAACSPGNIGFSSQILLDLMGSLEDSLGIIIPLNQYIFFDKTEHKQLTIKEAAQKLIKIAKDGK